VENEQQKRNMTDSETSTSNGNDSEDDDDNTEDSIASRIRQRRAPSSLLGKNDKNDKNLDKK
jgi:hypothetical protein